MSDAAHHCVQLRIDLLFTMSDNLHRVIEDRRDTNSWSWTSVECALRAASFAERQCSIDRNPTPNLELKIGLVEPDGIEPTTSCLQSRRSPN